MGKSPGIILLHKSSFSNVLLPSCALIDLCFPIFHVPQLGHYLYKFLHISSSDTQANLERRARGKEHLLILATIFEKRWML